MTDLHQSELGKHTEYPEHYQPEVLFPIAREDNRRKLNHEFIDFIGEDLWTAYELSWLAPDGRPKIAIAEIRIPHDSTHMPESKSLKLYLNSLNQTKFEDEAKVRDTIQDDLSAAVGAQTFVELYSQREYMCQSTADNRALNLDEIPLGEAPLEYSPNAGLLALNEDSSEPVSEYLCSDLLRSNCPVTDQPDWGSLYIEYRGPAIDHESLLRYIISFRQCQDFHEHCVERIFADIMEQCRPTSLNVYARYLRRGGLDINPLRTTRDLDSHAESLRTARQ